MAKLSDREVERFIAQASPRISRDPEAVFFARSDWSEHDGHNPRDDLRRLDPYRR